MMLPSGAAGAGFNIPPYVRAGRLLTIVDSSVARRVTVNLEWNSHI